MSIWISSCTMTEARVEGWWHWSQLTDFLVADTELLWDKGWKSAATITICLCQKGRGEPVSLQGIPWNQQPSWTGWFNPQVCQNAVLWAMPLWWHRKRSKYPFCLLLSKCCSQLFKDFQNCLRLNLRSHPLQSGEKSEVDEVVSFKCYLWQFLTRFLLNIEESFDVSHRIDWFIFSSVLFFIIMFGLSSCSRHRKGACRGIALKKVISSCFCLVKVNKYEVDFYLYTCPVFVDVKLVQIL